METTTAMPLAEATNLVAGTAAALHKRVGSRSSLRGASLSGKILAAFDIDDGSSLVVLDGGPEIVPLPAERADAGYLRAHSGSIASARVERDMVRGGLRWSFAIGDSYADATRRGAATASDVDLRALLFAPVTYGVDRPYVRAGAVYEDPRTKIVVTFDGEALDQDDLDVYLATLALARRVDAAQRFRFVRASFDAQLGRSPNVAVLAPSLARLAAATVTLRSPAYSEVLHPLAYAGNDGADRWQATIGLELAPLLDGSGYTAVATVRARLGDPIAKWLHAKAFAARANVEANVADLARLAGAEPDAAFEARVRNAVDEVVALGSPFAARGDAKGTFSLLLD